jgi:hypothetical protein
MQRKGKRIMPAKPYNGYASWNQWNVSLWINNDESLYCMAREYVSRHGYEKGARYYARDMEGEKTPDGGRYNLTAIRNAIRGILE